MQGCELQRLLTPTVDLRTHAGELGVQPDASAGVLAGQ